MEALSIVHPVAASAIAVVKTLNQPLYRGRRSLVLIAAILHIVMFRVFAVADWPTLPRR